MMRLYKKIRTRSGLHLGLIIIVVLTLMSTLVLVFNYASRKGPLGFGPPAPMKMYLMKDKSFSIMYPGNWVVFETPQGSHGDDDVVAIILVSGRSAANVTIARRSFINGDIHDVLVWGQLRAASNIDYIPASLDPLVDNKLGGFTQDYTWRGPYQNDVTRHCQDMYVFKNEVGYTLSFCSQEQDWVSLEDFYIQMWQSFTILGEDK